MAISWHIQHNNANERLHFLFTNIIRCAKMKKERWLRKPVRRTNEHHRPDHFAPFHRRGVRRYFETAKELALRTHPQERHPVSPNREVRSFHSRGHHRDHRCTYDPRDTAGSGDLISGDRSAATARRNYPARRKLLDQVSNADREAEMGKRFPHQGRGSSAPE